MALADNALTTVDQVSINDQATAERLINTASQLIENRCSRSFKKKTYNEKKKGNDRQILVLDHRPILDVASVVLDGNTLDINEYEIEDEEAGLLSKHDLWAIGESLARRSVSSDIIPNTSKYNITVTYEAGYVLPKDATAEEPRTLPYDLEQACILLTNHLYKTQNKDLNLQRESIADLSKTYFKGQHGQLPSEVDAILVQGGWVDVV